MNGALSRADVANLQLDRAEQLLDSRQIVEAIAMFDVAEETGADADRCAGGRWLAAMLAGDFERAWQESDSIMQRGSSDPHRFWDGRDLAGKRVIVRCLHGFGDMVQMLRYLPSLRLTAAQVVVEVPPRMLPLVPFFSGVEKVTTWSDHAAPAWDAQVEIMELPYIFRTTVQQLPVAGNYLNLPRSIVKDTARAMKAATKPRVGMVWAAGEWNPQRSIPLSVLQSLLAVEGVEFWSLQGGAAADRSTQLNMRSAILECGDGLVPLASTIANMDLVITVDTLAAHLASALGRPAWVMLQFAADWRWMIDRTDSPWYPALRLFRQHAPNDWESVIEMIRHALQDWLNRGAGQ